MSKELDKTAEDIFDSFFDLSICPLKSYTNSTFRNDILLAIKEATTAQQSIIDGQKERIEELTEALRQMRDVYFYKDGERTGHLWEICNTALNQTKP